MEKLKSSLNELRGVLIELQTEIITRPKDLENTPSSFSNEDEKELQSLRRKNEQTKIALSSVISKLEMALK
ncbi:MAG: hypothetical protein ACTSXV_00455 [Alphaproteobacteria bacterium]